MLKTRLKVRIGWGDCDPADIVYYPNYFRWFDNSTHNLFRTAGLDMAALYAKYNVVGMPIVEAKANFVAPSQFDEEIEVESFVSEWREKGFTITHRIYNKGVLSVEGYEAHVWAGKHPTVPGRLKALPVPAEVVAKFGG